MRDVAPLEARQQLARDAHAHQHRLRPEIGRIGLLVGLLHPRVADQPGQVHPGRAIALRWGLPIDLRDARASLAGRLGERRQSDVDDAGLILEPEAHGIS